MTGYPSENRPTFRAVAMELRQQGFDVVSPDELDSVCPPEQADWEQYMRRDIPYLVTCDVGVALPNWQKSRGAVLEVTILTRLAVPVLQYPNLKPIPEEDLPRIVVPQN